MKYLFVAYTDLDIIVRKIVMFYTCLLLKKQFSGFTVTENLMETFKGDDSYFNDDIRIKMSKILEENAKEIYFEQDNTENVFSRDEAVCVIDIEKISTRDEWRRLFSKCKSNDIKIFFLKASPFLEIPFMVKYFFGDLDKIKNEIQYCYEDMLDILPFLDCFDEIITLEDFLNGEILDGFTLKYNSVLEMTNRLSKEWFDSNLDLVKEGFNFLSSKSTTSQLNSMGYNKPTFEEFKGLFLP